MTLALSAAALMLIWPETVMAAARQACALWAQTVLPGLLPFLICLTYAAGRMRIKAGRPCPLTGLSRSGRCVMLMGLVTGSPGGARLMGEAARRGLLSPGDGLRLALWGGSMSPMFVMGTLPLWLGQGEAGWRLLAAHWLGVFCAGEWARLLPVGPCPAFPQAKGEEMTLPGAVESAARALLSVCGCMVLGAWAGALLKRLLPDLPPLWAAMAQCLTEVTAGCQALLEAGAPAWLLPGFVSLGGLSLFLQNMAFWPRGWFHPGWVAAGRGVAFCVSLGAGRLLLGDASAFAGQPLPPPSPPWLIAFWLLLALAAPLKSRRRHLHADVCRCSQMSP